MLELVLLLVIIVWLVSLVGRIHKIEETLSSLQKNAGVVNSTSENVTQDTPEGTAIAPDTAVGEMPAVQTTPNFSSRIFSWLSHEWPLKLGSVFVLIGIGWFVSYAFTAYAIGPQGRVLAGLLVGSVILAAGYIRAKKDIHQSAVLVALGGSVEMLSLYTATTVYTLISPEIAFFLFGFVLIYISFLAYTHKYQPMALIALIMAAVIPLIVGGTSLSLATFFIYMLAVVSGSLWLVVITQWRVLTLLANTIVLLHSLPYLYDSMLFERVDIIERFTFVFTFAGIFFIARLIDQYANKKTFQEDIIGSIVNTFFVLSWIYAGSPAHLQSAFAGWAAATTLLAGWVIYFFSPQQKSSLVLYASFTLLFAFFAVFFELEKTSLPIVLSVMILIYTLLLSRILDNPTSAARTGLLFILPVIAVHSDRFSPFTHNTSLANIVTSVLVVAFSLYLFAYYFYNKLHRDSRYAEIRHSIVGAMYVGTAYLYLAIQDASYLLLVGITQEITPIIIIAAIGTALYVFGSLKIHTSTRVLGLLTMMYISARILLIDSHSMSISAKIASFICIGVIFMSTMFINKYKKT